MSNLTHSPVNDQRFSDFLRDCRELGRDEALGKDALAKMAFKLAKAASDGVIDTTPNKHGEGVDDAKKAYHEYVEGFSKKSIHEMTENGKKANIAKFRAIVRCAVEGRGGKYDMYSGLERTKNAREALDKGGAKVKPAFASYVDYSRAQYKADSDLTDQQIKEVVTPAGKPDPELMKEWEKILKRIEKIVTGEIEGVPADQSAEALSAAEAVAARVAALMTNERRVAAQSKVRELVELTGKTVSDDEFEELVEVALSKAA